MDLKQVEIIDRGEPDNELTIAVNAEKIVLVRPLGEDNSEIILDGGTVLKTKGAFKETVRLLS